MSDMEGLPQRKGAAFPQSKRRSRRLLLGRGKQFGRGWHLVARGNSCASYNLFPVTCTLLQVLVQKRHGALPGVFGGGLVITQFVIRILKRVADAGIYFDVD